MVVVLYSNKKNYVVHKRVCIFFPHSLCSHARWPVPLFMKRQTACLTPSSPLAPRCAAACYGDCDGCTSGGVCDSYVDRMSGCCKRRKSVTFDLTRNITHPIEARCVGHELRVPSSAARSAATGMKKSTVSRKYSSRGQQLQRAAATWRAEYGHAEYGASVKVDFGDNWLDLDDDESTMDAALPSLEHNRDLFSSVAHLNWESFSAGDVTKAAQALQSDLVDMLGSCFDDDCADMALWTRLGDVTDPPLQLGVGALCGRIGHESNFGA
jgi:hypothetical protein